MREALSNLLVTSAAEDPSFLALTGDHGYALFDALRGSHPSKYFNVGIAEQAMIGVAAGLASSGFLPVVYGLAAFIPMRVLEQIKIDLCAPSLPVILLGDGAGLVYSTLGFSHQCGEDLACLRPLPNIHIFTPADEHELRICFAEARKHKGPSYIRIGKADRPELKVRSISSEPYFTCRNQSETVLVAHGAMASVAANIAMELGLSSVSIPRIKPFPTELGKLVAPFKRMIVLEEHCLYGGLTSAVCEYLCLHQINGPKITALTLADKFTEFAGGHQFALSEHGISDEQVKLKVMQVCGI